MSLNELKIIAPILKALKAKGYTEATPVQSKAIPHLLEGADLLGCAQTGTGKTAAFAVPILQHLANTQADQKGPRKIRALVVAPTRELALQISDSFVAYGANLNQRTAVIFGGVGQGPQTLALKTGVDILVATPGRLLDLIWQGYIDLSYVEHFVLDEADQMLERGMWEDVKKIITFIPEKRQTMFFSATMPAEIAKLADTILKDPVKITITPKVTPLDVIDQEVYFVDKVNKSSLLMDILKAEEYDSVLVFSRTKHGADKIVRELTSKGFRATAIHGNKSQSNRQQALNDFKKRKFRILVATDIAARGLDIQELSHVVNYNLPEVPETYVHRIGRTGRAGLGGKAISFCDFEELPLLHDIEKLIGKQLPEVTGHPYPLVNTTIKLKVKPVHRPKQSGPKDTRRNQNPGVQSGQKSGGQPGQKSSQRSDRKPGGNRGER